MAENDEDETKFRSEFAAIRSDFETGGLDKAIESLMSEPWNSRDRKNPERVQLLKEIYAWMQSSLADARHTATPALGGLLAELYSIWPKVALQAAILKHDFPENKTSEDAVSGAESVQVAERSVGLEPSRPVAMSRGKYWLKLWDLESGEVIRAEERELPMLASTIGRDSSHILTGDVWVHSETHETHWSANFRETSRRIPTWRGGTYDKSQYRNVKYYKVRGEVISHRSERTLEVDRTTFEHHPIRGEVLRPRQFKEQTPRYLEWLREVYSAAEVEDILREDAQDREREKQIIRVKEFETLTLAHDEIEGYLPAETTTFVARSDEYSDLKVDDVRYGSRIFASLAVEDEETWLEDIIAPGHGLKGMYGVTPTTPITAVCLSSDGSLALRNGNGENFGIWNVWTGDRLREFKGHSDRITCLCLSVDVSFAVSGSEDKTVRLWKPITAECVRVLAGHENIISCVCISLDATQILSADYDGVIKLWDVASGRCLRTIQAHSQKISGLHFTVDRKFAVSGSWDQTVKLWNLADGSCMKTLEHDDWVTSVDMTPDGRYLVSSSYEGTKVWELLWQLQPRDVAAWDEGARPYLEILMNANAAWDGKLSTPVDMTEEEKRNTLRRQGPSWLAWHAPSKKNDWHRVFHLNWDIEETLGHAGYGWLTEAGRESRKIMDEWKRLRQE